MAMKGMDVEAGRQASQQINQGSQELEALSGKMTQVIQGFDWIGPDADRTRDTWSSDYVTMLQKVTQSLQEFSTLINNQAGAGLQLVRFATRRLAASQQQQPWVGPARPGIAMAAGTTGGRRPFRDQLV
jgi:hypothetical protein